MSDVHARTLDCLKRRWPFIAEARARLFVGVLLGLAILYRPITGAADAPKNNPVYVEPSPWISNKHICLAVADDQEAGMCLPDLARFTPRWRIPPPVWHAYPEALDDVPLVARSYSQETIAYLAQHEVRDGDQSGAGVALTFDCEHSPEIALSILDILRRENVQATFFLQGRFAYRNPHVVRQMVADGHELGSHSFFHPLFTDLAPATMTQEITYTEAAVAWAVGEYLPMRFFRFPYAGRNRATLEHVAALGYQSSFWNLDPRGWDPSISAEDVVDAVQQRVHAGSILIMHCTSLDDARALPGVIRVIREHDLTPGRLVDVLLPQDRDLPGYAAGQSP